VHPHRSASQQPRAGYRNGYPGGSSIPLHRPDSARTSPPMVDGRPRDTHRTHPDRAGSGRRTPPRTPRVHARPDPGPRPAPSGGLDRQGPPAGAGRSARPADPGRAHVTPL
jgi:hypothetical protein